MDLLSDAKCGLIAGHLQQYIPHSINSSEVQAEKGSIREQRGKNQLLVSGTLHELTLEALGFPKVHR